MKKWCICSLLAITILSIQNNAWGQEIELLKSTHLPSYPSASTIEYYHNRLYVIGDDAPQMLVLNQDHQPVDSLLLFKSKGKRIDKDLKPDLEASVLITKNDRVRLVVFSSFSTPQRNKILIIPLPKKDHQKRHFKVVNAKLPSFNVGEINIEGAAYVNGKIILSNRANNQHKENHLILADYDTEKGIISKGHTVIKLQLPPTQEVIGVSGLSYVKEKDLLLFTASTEQTDNAYADGAIGASYLGYIYGFSKLLERNTIQADGLLNLSEVLDKQGPQKIESIAVEEVKDNELIVHLVADNDNGESHLFKARLQLPAAQQTAAPQ